MSSYVVPALFVMLFAWLPDLVPHAKPVGVRIFSASAQVLAVAVLVQCLYYATESAWPVWPWYLYLEYLLAAVVIARFVVCAASGIAAYNLSLQRIVTLLFALILLILGIRLVWSVALAENWNSFNKVSLEMIGHIPSVPHKQFVIAMGDRSGGLAYWGAGQVRVVQTEGLMMDLAYLKALQLGKGAEYLAKRFSIDYYAVDREIVPTYRSGGETFYIVTDPIQGLVTTASVLTFCFPQSALIYRRSYLWEMEPAQRLVFAFSARVPCPKEAIQYIQTMTGEGLHQLSLPYENACFPP